MKFLKKGFKEMILILRYIIYLKKFILIDKLKNKKYKAYNTRSIINRIIN